MGMSASQMRYCMLSGRKSDVEFQGQQINQQRTTLATETAAYNNQLLNLTVPTPPSADSYTKTSYSFNSNGEERTVTGTVYNSTNGTYTVNYTREVITSKGQPTGTSVFARQNNTDGSVSYLTSSGTILDPVITTSGTTGYSASDVSNLSLICQDCGIRDSGGRAYGAPGYVMPNFFKYTSGSSTKYILESELVAHAGTTTAITTYSINDNVKETQSGQMTGADVEWTDTGRMASITDADGTNYSLSVTSENDDAAYTDAMNEYEYKKSIYDQQLDNINSQIDIVESQDKKLELKLQNLDTQQQAITTEMDSVKKVIDKNIEQSFKAFA